MRDAVANPFVPGSDAVPQLWAGRFDQLADVQRLRQRRRAGQYERGRAVLGPPGMGKSALVRRVARESAAEGDLVLPTVRLDRAADPVGAVAAAVRAGIEATHVGERVAAGVARVLARFEEVSTPIGGLRLREPAAGAATIAELLGLLADAVAPRLVQVTVDEVQAPDDARGLSALMTGLADALAATRDERDAAGTIHQMHLGVVVIVSGLPSFWAAAERAGTTFARRLAPVQLRPIPDEDLRAALGVFARGGWAVPDGLVSMTADAIDLLVARSGNDPFLFQLVGQAAWEAGDGPSITADEVHAGWGRVRDEAERHVRRLLADVAPRERQLLERLAELPEAHRTLTEAATSFGDTASRWADAAANLDLTHGLVARGRPYRLQHGALEALLRDGWP